MATLWVGSRKGLFRFDEGLGGWTMAGPPAFLAAPVTAILDDPRDGRLYAGLAHGHFGCKFHRSDDRGHSWAELAAPAFAPSDAADAPSVEMIWCFAAGGVGRAPRRVAGYLAKYVCKSVAEFGLASCSA